MSNTLANYTFLPWLRLGVANKVQTGDLDTDVKLRASVKIELDLTGDPIQGDILRRPISRNVELFGPGDVIGIDQKAIVKTEPHNWITNFEPNYMPYIEFYDEDFPWRYTPASPDQAKDRLRPWITLVVLKEGDFTEGKNMLEKPLGYITVEDAAVKFPPADQLWAWAHVHVNEGLMNNISGLPSDKDAVTNGLKSLLASNPDLASSRIVCPVKLDSNTAYHAFLIPSFETGRLAGLNLGVKVSDLPAEVHATLSAWADYSNKKEAVNFPFYYRWYFRTGNVGDFEYLVRLLQPREVDKRVGRRDMDVEHPGSNLTGIEGGVTDGILKLGGALRIPFETMTPHDQAEVLKFDNWDKTGYPQPFQEDLASFINLAEAYTRQKAADANLTSDLADAIREDEDPLITPPLYGRWHSLSDRLLKDKDGNDLTPDNNWVHELNLDPRWRVAAGFGTRIVQENQEDYMEAAWKQVGDILEANRKMRLAQLAKTISKSWHEKQVAPLVMHDPEKAMFFTAPVQKRVLANGFTVYQQVRESVISRSLPSMPMRRILRPGGRLMKSLEFTGEIKQNNLLTRINAREVTLAPPKEIPAGLPDVNRLAEAVLPKNVPLPVVNILRKVPWIRWLALGILLTFLLLIFFVSLPAAVVGLLSAACAVLAVFFQMSRKWEKQIETADSVREENQTPESVDNLRKSPDFRLSSQGDGFTPSKGNSDSTEAIRYKSALKDSFTIIQTGREAGQKRELSQLDLPALMNVTFTAIDPLVTIPKFISRSVLIPERIRAGLAESFIEAMAYPEINVPMYKPLVSISSELFLPNINYIGQNTISLLETNQPFIESYMAGLNHEFARELLWREYPTDQRGSYFRQFWDVSSFFDTEGTGEEKLREKLKDIPPLHRWLKDSKLGDHDNREAEGVKEEEVVLVIRGELLKKYPTAVIYAQKAKWQLNEDGTINLSEERELVQLTAQEEAAPPGEKMKVPLYEAKADPDIYFFGFDLTAGEVRGGTGEAPGDIDKPGWFFCIKERPGESRFGLDIDRDETPNVWNDLSWEDMAPGASPGTYLKVGDTTATIGLSPLDTSDNEKEEQRNDDDHVSWNKNMNAADVAYILYQVPVLVAVHGSEMLTKK